MPSQGCLRKSQERLAESCLHAPLTGFQRALLEVARFPKEGSSVDGDAQSHGSAPGHCMYTLLKAGLVTKLAGSALGQGAPGGSAACRSPSYRRAALPLG